MIKGLSNNARSFLVISLVSSGCACGEVATPCIGDVGGVQHILSYALAVKSHSGQLSGMSGVHPHPPPPPPHNGGLEQLFVLKVHHVVQLNVH